jgi:predicted HTH domain antitoxin
MSVKRSAKQLTKSVRFSEEEATWIEQVSRREHLPEGTLMRKLVLDGLAELRLEQAVADYAAGDLNLTEAAHRAGVSVRRLMTELERRGVELLDARHMAASLETLADLFGGSPELRLTLDDLRRASR